MFLLLPEACHRIERQRTKAAVGRFLSSRKGTKQWLMVYFYVLLITTILLAQFGTTSCHHSYRSSQHSHISSGSSCIMCISARLPSITEFVVDFVLLIEYKTENCTGATKISFSRLTHLINLCAQPSLSFDFIGAMTTILHSLLVSVSDLSVKGKYKCHSSLCLIALKTLTFLNGEFS